MEQLNTSFLNYILHVSKFALWHLRHLANSRQKSYKFSSLLFTVTSTAALPEISISSNSRNLLQFLQFSYCTLQRKKGGKPDRKPYPLPYVLNPYRNIHSENSQDYALETSTKLYIHEFGLCIVCLYGDLKGAGVHASGWRGAVGPDGDRLPQGHQVCLPQLRGFRHNSKVVSG